MGDEDVEGIGVMAGDVAVEDACGDADATDYDDELEGVDVRHVYYISREERHLVLTSTVSIEGVQESYIVKY